MLTEPNNISRAVSVLKVIAHPLRMAVIELLSREGKMSVSKMCELLNCEQSLLSHHLANLKMYNLLKTEKDRRFILYRINESESSLLMQCIKVIELTKETGHKEKVA